MRNTEGFLDVWSDLVDRGAIRKRREGPQRLCNTSSMEPDYNGETRRLRCVSQQLTKILTQTNGVNCRKITSRINGFLVIISNKEASNRLTRYEKATIKETKMLMSPWFQLRSMKMKQRMLK